eukprot:gb/GEZN01017173.1/.p2 GENE.gb/GEZN01017173.1/~~gb/GEZN01017173.1/.p2  ORF type:complete len:105 (-),score=2.13 gb/GEZN01017173.1/:339-653(-)
MRYLVSELLFHRTADRIPHLAKCCARLQFLRILPDSMVQRRRVHLNLHAAAQGEFSSDMAARVVFLSITSEFSHEIHISSCGAFHAQQYVFALLFINSAFLNLS